MIGRWLCKNCKSTEFIFNENIDYYNPIFNKNGDLVEYGTKATYIMYCCKECGKESYKLDKIADYKE